MTPRQRRAAQRLLDQAHVVLERIQQLGAEGRERYVNDEARRQQLRYLWIVAGSVLKNYCELSGIELKASVFTPVIDFRHVLAYHPPDQIDDELVWNASATEAATWLAHLDQTRMSLG